MALRLYPVAHWLSAALLMAPASGQVIAPAMALPDPVPVRLGADRRMAADSQKLSLELRVLAQATPLVTTTMVSGPMGNLRRDSDVGSGILVAPCLVLTARHVLAPILPDATGTITVRFSDKLTLAGRMLAMGGQPGRQRGNLADDWALVQLAQPATGIAPIALLSGNCCARAGMRAAVIGYPADRFNRQAPLPWVDPACTVVARMIIRILAVDCQATSGNSGGPLLVKTDMGWRLAGIITRAPAGSAGGPTAGLQAYALPVEAFLAGQVSAATAGNCGNQPPAQSSPQTEIPLGKPKTPG